MKLLLKLLPLFFVALFGVEIIAVFMPKKDGEFHLREFGRLPVLMNGRIQPFDSVGRNALLQIRGTGDVPLEMVPSWKFWHHPEKLRSSAWLAELFFRPEQADTRHVFLIHHPEILSELELRDKGLEKSGLRYYTFNDLKPVLAEIWEQGNNARQIEDAHRTAVQKQMVKLQHAVFQYQSLKMALHPPQWDDFPADLAKFETEIPAIISSLHALNAHGGSDENVDQNVLRQVSMLMQFSKDPNAGQAYPLIIPPANPEHARDDWGNMGIGLLQSLRDREVYPPMKFLAAMSSAYANDNAPAFNQAVADYKQWFVKEKFDVELKKGRHEFFYNDTKAFLHAMIMYICAFVLACGALLTLSVVPGVAETMRRSAFGIIVLAFLLHTFGLIFRMYLEARPPVTNLYSSAVFIGWGAILLGMLLERFFKVGLGLAVGALAGFVTLIIAHNLAIGQGDTMEMMRAVLDTNFWLATHVVVITLGYSSTFMAGLLGIAFILLGLFTPVLKTKAGKLDIGKALAKMAYAIICFATLFSFAGTVLGGIWADQSWGRFWGWDPKENGALIIVLWNALILHARWGGLVRERGLMNLAIVGNIVTAWSWFGVNMLGVGLHSYGFMDAAFKWLMYFIASQLFVIALGLVPLRFWRSFRDDRRDESKSLPGAAEPAAA